MKHVGEVFYLVGLSRRATVRVMGFILFSFFFSISDYCIFLHSNICFISSFYYDILPNRFIWSFNSKKIHPKVTFGSFMKILCRRTICMFHLKTSSWRPILFHQSISIRYHPASFSSFSIQFRPVSLSSNRFHSVLFGSIQCQSNNA